MVIKAECKYIGKLTKTHGTKGNIIIKNKAGIPVEPGPGTWVFIDIDDGLIPFRIQYINVYDDNTISLIFEDVVNEEQAKVLCDKDLYIPKEDSTKTNSAQTNFKHYKVVDEVYGTIGIVDDFYNLPDNPLLKILHVKGDVFIPFKDEFIREINHDKKMIKTMVPLDIIDINFN